MTDILGREIKKGQFVIFSRRMGNDETMSAGIVLDTGFRVNSFNGRMVETVNTLGTTYSTGMKTWDIGLRIISPNVKRVYITDDLPAEVKKRLLYAAKIF